MPDGGVEKSSGRFWTHFVKKNVLLIGDSAHATVPFYGQGMNAGFEDCRILSDMLDIYKENYEKCFDQFSIEANFKKLKSKIALISLDSIADYSRYLYMHTIGYSSDKINLTFGEAIISSGVKN